jgi:hypothetical protein
LNELYFFGGPSYVDELLLKAPIIISEEFAEKYVEKSVFDVYEQ